MVEESKFAKSKTTRTAPKAKNSSSLLDQVAAFKRQASMAPHKDSSTIFAVKIISKKKVLEAQQQEHLFNEIKYMSKLNNNLVCMMRGVAQDSRNLYILMDYMQ